MPGYIFDTNVLSMSLDPSRAQHDDVRAAIGELDPAATQFISAISLAELAYGVRLIEIFNGSDSPNLQRILKEAQEYAVIHVTNHTSSAYAEMKANLARTYLAKAGRKDRPRWVEDWVDKTTGQKLQVDENDLWICAQAKERDLILVTSDHHMDRIPKADSEVRLILIA